MYEIEKESKTPIETVSIILANIGAFILSSIEAIVVALALSVVLYLFFMTPHEVVGSSMVPNFQNGQHLIANKILYKISMPKRGDVIIFRFSESQDFIKRIIGLPGDKISLMDGKLYVNDKELNENEYLAPTVYTKGGNFIREGETITVPKNEYFVAGDNRPGSSDSREFGTISRDSIKGKVWLIYFPFNEFKVVHHARYNN